MEGGEGGSHDGLGGTQVSKGQRRQNAKRTSTRSKTAEAAKGKEKGKVIGRRARQSQTSGLTRI